MISYDRLGSNGRLGNQMFQYAALRGIAKHRNFDWMIPPKNHPSLTNYSIQDCFKLKNLTTKNIGFLNNKVGQQEQPSFYNLVSSNPQVKNRIERSFEFDEDLFNNLEDYTNIDGFFQTEKYFKHIEDEIREDFEFIDDILEPCKEFISQFSEVIFLHIRRGDNVGRDDLCRIPTLDGYYTDALSHFSDTAAVLVCSDDIEWCNQQSFFDDERFYLSENNERYSHKCLDGDNVFRKSTIPYIDLCLMSLCNGGIIPTSTLSWWGGYLQKNRTNPIIVQDPWFGPTLSYNNTKDLIPDDWIQLSW
jgi:hypothetical protein